MSDYFRIQTLPGAIGSEYVGDLGDLELLTLQEARTVLSFQAFLIDVATADVIVELRDQAGGLGQSMQVTIPAGDGKSNVNTSSFTVATGAVLYLRIVQTGPDAGGLYGTLSLNDVSGGVTPGVDQDLTTDSIILERDPQAASVSPSVRDQIRTGVSARMVAYMGRQINQLSVTERHSVSAASVTFTLDEYPVANSVLTLNGSALSDGTDYDVDGNGIVTRIASGNPIKWAPGYVNATYDAGYEFVPPALVDLATIQSIFEIYKSDKNNRLIPIESRAAESGDTFTLNPDGFLPSVVQGMLSWKKWN